MLRKTFDSVFTGGNGGLEGQLSPIESQYPGTHTPHQIIGYTILSSAEDQIKRAAVVSPGPGRRA